MAEQVQRIETVTTDEPAVQPMPSQSVRQPEAAGVPGVVLAKRIIWFLTDLLLILLAFRFVLALLGANPSNWFANFIYSVTHPFVAPFFGLFNYNQQFGISRFEGYTLIAMLVYLMIAWGLTKLLSLGKPVEPQT